MCTEKATADSLVSSVLSCKPMQCVDDYLLSLSSNSPCLLSFTSSSQRRGMVQIISFAPFLWLLLTLLMMEASEGIGIGLNHNYLLPCYYSAKQGTLTHTTCPCFFVAVVPYPSCTSPTTQESHGTVLILQTPSCHGNTRVTTCLSG